MIGEVAEGSAFIRVDTALREHLHLFKGATLPVLMAIALHTNKRGVAWPKGETLCMVSGYCPRTVKVALRALRAMTIGNLRVLIGRRVHNARGEYTRTEYRLFVPVSQVGDWEQDYYPSRAPTTRESFPTPASAVQTVPAGGRNCTVDQGAKTAPPRAGGLIFGEVDTVKPPFQGGTAGAVPPPGGKVFTGVPPKPPTPVDENSPVTRCIRTYAEGWRQRYGDGLIANYGALARHFANAMRRGATPEEMLAAVHEYLASDDNHHWAQRGHPWQLLINDWQTILTQSRRRAKGQNYDRAGAREIKRELVTATAQRRREEREERNTTRTTNEGDIDDERRTANAEREDAGRRERIERLQRRIAERAGVAPANAERHRA